MDDRYGDEAMRHLIRRRIAIAHGAMARARKLEDAETQEAWARAYRKAMHELEVWS